jgi:hypothetical protein
MTNIVVELSADLARAAREGRSSEGLDRIYAAAAAGGVELAAVHPGTDDENLSRFLAGEAPDGAAASAAAERLAELPGVQAAYIKPAPSVP